MYIDLSLLSIPRMPEVESSRNHHATRISFYQIPLLYPVQESTIKSLDWTYLCMYVWYFTPFLTIFQFYGIDVS